MVPLYPFTFKPILKERVWGGRRLGQLYGKKLPADVPVGESWEISDRPGDCSVIANGEFAGKDLRWLVENRREDLLGDVPLQGDRFPLLIKILDATEKLSLQVHPPPRSAAALGGDPKTELWYIAEASPEAELYVGLRKGCTKDDFALRLEQGTVADCFHRIRVCAGDAMFLPSGRVHAIGAGLVIFEIQQNSDTTYRVFDWNRPGLDGRLRETHVQQSLASIDFNDYEPELVRPLQLSGLPQVQSLVRNELFNVDIVRLEQGQTLPLEGRTMQIIGVVSGAVRISGGSHTVSLSSGGFCLIPASLERSGLIADSAVTCLCVRAGK